jgi:hypothetical protein
MSNEPRNRRHTLPVGPRSLGTGLAGTVLFGLGLLLVGAIGPARHPTPSSLQAEGTGTMEACTVGIATGRATRDGRPMIWKTRDSAGTDNEVVWVTSAPIHYLAVVDAGSPAAWMGLNERGFAILNSASSDLPGGRGTGNGQVMSQVLGTCSSVAEFEAYLGRTNTTGRSTQANYLVLDAGGAVAIYETAGNAYWKYDANDPETAPYGYLVKTNFAFHGGGQGGIERYYRTSLLVPGYHAAGRLEPRSILRQQMRDFARPTGEPLPIPFPDSWEAGKPAGYIHVDKSICRTSSVSAAVMQGVKPGEPATLSTFWVMLGQPAASITLPYWPVGPTPPEADGPRTAPLCDASRRIRDLLFDLPGADNRHFLDTRKLKDGHGGGLWPITLAAEDSIFTATDALLNEWRRRQPTAATILQAEGALAKYALGKLQYGYSTLKR